MTDSENEDEDDWGEERWGWRGPESAFLCGFGHTKLQAEANLYESDQADALKKEELQNGEAWRSMVWNIITHFMFVLMDSLMFTQSETSKDF